MERLATADTAYISSLAFMASVERPATSNAMYIFSMALMLPVERLATAADNVFF